MTASEEEINTAPDGAISFEPDEASYDIYECSDCDNIVLVIGRDDPPMSCHNRPMERVTEFEMDVRTPDIREVMLSAFGLPKAGLDICLCVIGEGPLPANDIAEMLGYDRSTVTRYLNDLVDIGLLDRAVLNREEGGVVKVYHSIDVEQMRRDTLIGFYVWAGEAASLIEEANLTKQQYLETNPEQDLPGVFWDSEEAE